MSNKQALSPVPRSASVSITAVLTTAISLSLTPTPNSAGDIAQSPLYLTTAVPPVVMFAMSNDHQLYIKAYTDYSDIDDDGQINTTYTDEYDYFGYFDYRKCYSYSDGKFTPTGFADADTDNGHSCPGSNWSGNFLNWATMTRIDILRKVIYGGKRSTDTETETILERALLPKDVHAFAKIYSATPEEMQKLTPYAFEALSFCNVTDSNTLTQNISTTTDPPLMRVAKGLYENWAAGEVNQCRWGTNGAPADGSENDLGDLTVRVKVCDQAYQAQDVDNGECRRYGNGTKPFGLLQRYGEDAELPMRFGLVSGSYNKKIAGGVLRDRADQVSNNAVSTDAEINQNTGVFTGNQGIISTLDAFRIVSYEQNKYKDCDTYGIDINTFKTSTSENRQCRNWGNPVAEIFLETARYLVGAESPTAEFDTDDSNLLTALQFVDWDDPIRDDQWCANSQIVLISTTNNSFDWDDLSSAADLPGLSGAADVNAKTDEVGTLEGLTGSYVIGQVGTVDNDHDECTAKALNGLSTATGICPGAPSLEGGFAVAGLAYHTNITDLRAAADIQQDIQTFTVALARDIPQFQIAVGGGTVTLLPACWANNNGSAVFGSTGWRTCSMADLRVGDYTNATLHPVDAANDPDIRRDANGNLVAGRLLVHWEDSPWGNDYDLDGQALLEFCVGTECQTFETDCHSSNTQGNAPTDPFDPTLDISADQLMICTAAQYVQAGNALAFGITISGTDDDGQHMLQLRPGNQNFTHPNQTNAPNAVWEVFNQSGNAAQLLEPPIWYAAKYGGFKDLNDNNRPDLQMEWDVDRDGEPDNYFFAENPGQLGPRLARFLDAAQQESSAASVAANSLSQETESYVYQARFSSADWSGDLVKIPINRLADPSAGDSFEEDAVWSARDALDGQDWYAGRAIITATGVTSAIPFRWSEESAEALNSANIGNLLNYSVIDTEDGLGGARVNYIRGDDSNEGIDSERAWRDRTHLLGDLIHSAPNFVSEPVFNYPDDLEDAPYSSFKSALSGENARDGVVYVGGNDGMLHGFDDETGEEVIAYVPRAVYPTLRYLTDPQYEDPNSEKHRYYVDSSPNVKDACINSDGVGSCEWRTVLVSGLGAGGRGIFALDVTEPSSFSEDNAASIQLWDISAAENSTFALVADSGTDADGTAYSFTDLGYTFSEPSIVRLPDNNHDGKWVALFGNGYLAETDLGSGTGTGKAVLYFVDLATGQLLEQVVIDDSSSSNGLSSPAAVDLNRDNRIDLVYVGDLHGNIWRIEPASDGSRWQVSEFGTESPTPLFSTQTTTDGNGNTIYNQPITVLPEVAEHPDGGQLVLFGTGKYYERNDDSNTDLQSVYGVWDYYDAFEEPGAFRTITRADLQEQSIIHEEIVPVPGVGDTPSLIAVRILSDNDLTWWRPDDDTTDPGKMGWYLDLAVGTQREGERVVFNPAIEGGALILSTLIPSPNPCDFGGDSYIYITDLLTGGRLSGDIFGLGVVEITLVDGTTIEVPVSAIKPSAPEDATIAMQPTNIGRVRGGGAGGGEAESCGKQLYAVSTSDGDIEYLLTEAPTCSGRKSWTQVR